eukprot:CAMPEP_0194096040 /NCGR_PEP_ID=MMETSP0149-20130528/57140_1 /TAXON_ID=122233 /ORGANISM="Chaetoceros debilis, Strain MM31A-1" /LENGTH=567 /DNA_ID=CAMNT_0038782007 /DNA_START=437 /DNA_END=2140 /DNA_ORIENTATION=-
MREYDDADASNFQLLVQAYNDLNKTIVTKNKIEWDAMGPQDFLGYDAVVIVDYNPSNTDPDYEPFSNAESWGQAIQYGNIILLGTHELQPNPDASMIALTRSAALFTVDENSKKPSSTGAYISIGRAALGGTWLNHAFQVPPKESKFIPVPVPADERELMNSIIATHPTLVDFTMEAFSETGGGAKPFTMFWEWPEKLMPIAIHGTGQGVLPFILTMGGGVLKIGETHEPSSTPSANTERPTKKSLPNIAITDRPSLVPSAKPSKTSSERQTGDPSTIPSIIYTQSPSELPTSSVTSYPTLVPTALPSIIASSFPSASPSHVPTTSLPTMVPSPQPSLSPSLGPSKQNSQLPTLFPSASPSSNPTSSHPTMVPSPQPSVSPSLGPSKQNSQLPTLFPSASPSSNPTSRPYQTLSSFPSLGPSKQNSQLPTLFPSALPTFHSSFMPSQNPSNLPSSEPTKQISESPSRKPNLSPTTVSSFAPTSLSDRRTQHPSANLSNQPSRSSPTSPSMTPTAHPGLRFSSSPSIVYPEVPSSSSFKSPSSKSLKKSKKDSKSLSGKKGKKGKKRA